MADLTFILWQDQAMTQSLPNFENWPVIRVDYNGVETKTGVLYFGSPLAGKQLALQESSTDTNIKLSIVEANQAWQASKAVTSGKIVQPENGFMYRASKGGTTGATAPVWPLTLDTGVDDGSTRWINIGKAFDMSDILLATSEAGLSSGKSFVNLAATLNGGAAVPIWFKSVNTDAYARRDDSDPIVEFHINAVIEQAR